MELVNPYLKVLRQPHERIENKIHSMKSHYYGRIFSGKSIQGHSPVYEELIIEFISN